MSRTDEFRAEPGPDLHFLGPQPFWCVVYCVDLITCCIYHSSGKKDGAFSQTHFIGAAIIKNQRKYFVLDFDIFIYYSACFCF